MNADRPTIAMMLLIALALTSGCGADDGNSAPGVAPGAEGTERDRTLVGNWRRTVSNSATGVGSDLHVTSDFHLRLEANGRFTYSSSGAGSYGGRFGDAHLPIGSGPVEGLWKTEDAVLWYRVDGSFSWVPAGRYQVSGNTSVITTATGARQLWQRS